MDEQAKILIVDDERTTRQIIVAALSGNHDVFTAENGKEAVELCNQKKPDLILMDVMMPEMNGYQACQAIKDDPEFIDIPIIFLTAADKVANEMRGLKLGAIDYLTKPVDMGLLIRRVRNHLELKRKSDLVKQQRDLLEIQKAELEAALARITRLEGIISICMYCKNIRSDENSWEELESYIEKHSDAHFSHGICSACVEEKHPELKKEKFDV